MEQKDIEQLVSDLLKPTVDELMKSVKDYMHESQTALEKRLEVLELPQEPKKKQEDTTLPQDKAQSALDARVKDLEAKLKQAEELRINQEKQASSLRFDSNLSSALDTMKPLHKSVVQELLANRIKQDAVEKDGSWLTKDGKTINEAIAGFFETDAGKHFLPSNHQDGAGTTVAQPTRSTTAVDTVEALRQAFI